MSTYAIQSSDMTPPTFEQLMAWPAAWASFWWALQLECLNQLATPLGELPVWMRWYNGPEQLG